MLQQVILQSAVPVTLNIEAVEPDELIVIKSIDGLTPADVTLFTGDFAGYGGYYQGRRTGRRFPVFNLKLNADYVNDIEVSDIRESLYSTFYEPLPGTDGLQVVLIDDRKPDRYFVGYAEKFPADIFSKDTSAQITMVCVDPFIYSVDPVSDSDVVGWINTTIDYEGSAKTGFTAEIEINTATTQVVLDVNGDTMTLLGDFAVDDIITLSTVVHNRYIRLNGVDVMATLTPDSPWLQLRKGTNAVKVYGTAESDGKAVLMEYAYRAAWIGI